MCASAATGERHRAAPCRVSPVVSCSPETRLDSQSHQIGSLPLRPASTGERGDGAAAQSLAARKGWVGVAGFPSSKPIRSGQPAGSRSGCRWPDEDGPKSASAALAPAEGPRRSRGTATTGAKEDDGSLERHEMHQVFGGIHGLVRLIRHQSPKRYRRRVWAASWGFTYRLGSCQLVVGDYV